MCFLRKSQNNRDELKKTIMKISKWLQMLDVNNLDHEKLWKK